MKEIIYLGVFFPINSKYINKTLQPPSEFLGARTD